MGLYRKHRSVTEHLTEVSPIGYQALTTISRCLSTVIWAVITPVSTSSRVVDFTAVSVDC